MTFALPTARRLASALAAASFVLTACTQSGLPAATPHPAAPPPAIASAGATLPVDGLEIVATSDLGQAAIGHKIPEGYGLIVGSSAITSAEATRTFLGGQSETVALVVLRLTTGGRRAMSQVSEREGGRAGCAAEGQARVVRAVPAGADRFR